RLDTGDRLTPVLPRQTGGATSRAHACVSTHEHLALGGTLPGLQKIAHTAQGQIVPEDAKASHRAKAHAGNLRTSTTPDRIRDVHFDSGEAHLGERGDQGWLTGRVAGWIDQRSVHAAVMRLVDFVDDLADDIRVEDLDLDTQLGGIFADVLVVL